MPARKAVKPFKVEVRRDGRQAPARSIDKQPDWPKLLDEPAHGPVIKVKPTIEDKVESLGRVLPALDEARPVAEEAVAAARSKPKRRAARPSVRKAVTKRAPPMQAPPAAESETVQAPSQAEAAPAEQPLVAVVQSGLPHLPRSAFKAGERWKARLPAACYPKLARKRLKNS